MNPISQDASTSDNSQELKEIVGALSKITSRSPEEIKPHLEALIDRLNRTKEDDLAASSFYLYCQKKASQIAGNGLFARYKYTATTHWS